VPFNWPAPGGPLPLVLRRLRALAAILARRILPDDLNPNSWTTQGSPLPSSHSRIRGHTTEIREPTLCDCTMGVQFIHAHNLRLPKVSGPSSGLHTAQEFGISKLRLRFERAFYGLED